MANGVTKPSAEYLLRADRSLLVDIDTISALMREIDSRDQFLLALYKTLNSRKIESLSPTELEAKIRIAEFYADNLKSRNERKDSV